MNKLCIVTANHGRELVLKLYCEGVVRLQSQTDIEIISIIVGDENSVTSNYNCIHIPYKNIPLTEKFNVGCIEAQKHNPDYVMISGSDNLYNIELINYVASKTEHDFLNAKDIYFYSVSPPFANQVCYILTSSIGCARFIRKDLMDKLKWQPWKLSRDKGVDQVLWREVQPRWVNPHFFIGRDVGAIIVDIKSNDNINKLDKWIKTPRVSPQPILNFLSDKEKEILKKLLK